MTLSQCETESMMFLNGLMRISLMKSDLGAQSFGKHFSRQVMNKFFPCYRLFVTKMKREYGENLGRLNHKEHRLL